MPLENVFLSASIPYLGNNKNPKYLENADMIAIREAVLAVATVIVPNYCLIWGGHPLITPFIHSIYCSFNDKKNDVEVNADYHDHVRLYQSDFFKGKFIKQNDDFETVVHTKAIDNDIFKSLELMRNEMICKNTYIAGIFIGGMDGIEVEYKLFRKAHPLAPIIPLFSTGGAIGLMENEIKGDLQWWPEDFRMRFKKDHAYVSLLKDCMVKCEIKHEVNQRLGIEE